MSSLIFRWRMLLALLLLQPSTILLASEFSLIGTNEAKWADGSEVIDGVERSKQILENRLTLNLYRGSYRVGGRLTFLNPSEFGEERTGADILDKRYVEYSKPAGDFRVRVGDFYTVWGRGLTLALVEDIQQGFDTGLDGLLANGSFGSVDVEMIAGQSNTGWLGTVLATDVAGFHMQSRLPLNAYAGGQALYVQPTADGSGYDENRTYGGYFGIDRGAISMFLEYAAEAVGSEGFGSDATYASVSGYAGDFGVALDYKRYHYPLHLGNLNDAGSLYAQSVHTLPLHSPPIVQREITSTLLGRHPHVPRYDDEVGVQAELTWMFSNVGSMILAISQSSSQDAGYWIPSVSEEDSPYREAYLEIELYPGRHHGILWLGWNDDLIYSRVPNVDTRISWDRRSVVGGTGEISVGDGLTLIASVEAGRIEDINLSANHNEGMVGLGFGWRGRYQLVATGEFSEVQDDQTGRKNWYKVEGRARLLGGFDLTVAAGQERGGLVCTSGQCRVVTPFDGVRVTLTSNF